MIKILFVCHGNICRSPMAEFVLKDMVRKAGKAALFEIASAAVSCEEQGSDIYRPARLTLEKHGIPFARRAARQITKADCAYYDRIYYMDSANARYLRRLFPGETKFRPFLSRDVADPWYTGNFSQTWLDICEGCKRILEEYTC